MSTRVAKRSALVFLAALGCGETANQTAADKSSLRSSGAASDESGELALTADVRETVMALAGETVRFVKDFEIQVIQCADPKAAPALLKTATKAQFEAGEVRVSKQMKNLRVVLSKLKIESNGVAGELTPSLASGATLCSAYESFKDGGFQAYGSTPASNLSATVQSERNLASSYDFGVNQVAIAFDVAVRTQTDIAQVDVTLSEAARSVDSVVAGSSPTAFSINKASIVNKSALTDNTCTFQLTLKCTISPVVAKGKLVSCAGIELAQNPWRLEERSGATPVIQAQPTGSPNPLSDASLVGSDSINLPFTFACNRGKAGVATEKKQLALSVWNKMGCDKDSFRDGRQCGQQTFVFPIALTYSQP
jgi:hypothetical protein